MKARIKFSEVGRRILKWIPNSLTLCNSLCGFAAILYTLHAHEFRFESIINGADSGAMNVFNTVAILIFSAMIFDALDGIAARILNAASMHGIQMDSLSDMVTFGVAPAVLVVVLTDFLYSWRISGGITALLYICGAIYLGGAALRLATYNVYAIEGSKKNPNWFSGMPSPGAAAALCVVIFLMPQFRDFFRDFPLILPIYSALLGILMVSRIPYLHAGRFLMSVRHNPQRLIVLIALIAVVTIFRLPGLAVIVTLYVLSGPVLGLYNLFSKKEPIGQ
ncbi:MAG: CDP-alcohol phosphatidyltransferase family protein [Lentisphaeria bacterium]|nr:CDP-alcohol phosphatidyltransferase family protein [Lentisphaeria bacterium]